MKCYSDVILNIMSFKRFYPQLLEKTNRMCREICNAVVERTLIGSPTSLARSLKAGKMNPAALQGEKSLQ